MTVMEPVVGWLMSSGKKKVTLRQVMEGADRPRKPVLRVMDRLVREGCVEEITDNPVERGYRQNGPDRRNPTWKLLKPLSMPKRQTKRWTLRDKMWQVIRSKRHFAIVHVQRLAGCTYDTARIYIKMLERDGYVRRTGKDGGRVTWMLARGHKLVDRPVTVERKI